MIVSPDRREAFVMYTRAVERANPGLCTLRLAGLDSEATYRVECSFQSGALPGGGEGDYQAGGSLLMNAGLWMPLLYGDFQSAAWYLSVIG
jgi:hypothetical protein